MSKIDDWIDRQYRVNMAQWDKAIENNYPQYARMWRDPVEHHRCLKEYWNLLDAVKLINWPTFFIGRDLTLVDLGAGTGWLSAYLSNFEQVKKIYAIDSSYYLLHNMFEEIVKLSSGKKDKIAPVQGLFTPILLEDRAIDMVVVSSALHHSENISDTLKEVHRILKDGGYLFVLNETPATMLQYMTLQVKIFLSIMKNSILKKYKVASQSQSSNGILIDPHLGDRCYPRWYWIGAFQNSGFVVESIIETGLYSRKNEKAGNQLTHFICKKTRILQ